jgi:hypothetical protein
MAKEILSIPPDLLGNVERYAVYRCFSGAGELLYIGESGELGKRLAAHAQKAWFVQVRGITLEWYVDELDALNAERRAIHVEQPKYNVVGRSAPSARKPEPQARKSRAQEKSIRQSPRPFDELLAEARIYQRELVAGERLTKERLRLRLRVSSRKALEVLQAVQAESPRGSRAAG